MTNEVEKDREREIDIVFTDRLCPMLDEINGEMSYFESTRTKSLHQRILYSRKVRKA